MRVLILDRSVGNPYSLGLASGLRGLGEEKTVGGPVGSEELHGSMDGITNAFYMARNRPLFLRWALGATRLSALWRSAGRELVLIVSLIRRRRVADAARGAAVGWLVGASRVLVDGRR